MSPTGSGGATGVGFSVCAVGAVDSTGVDTGAGRGVGRATDCSAPSPAYPLSAITGPRSSTGPPVHGRTVAARRASAAIGADVSAAAATVTCAAGSAGGRAGGTAVAGRAGTAISAARTATADIAALRYLVRMTPRPSTALRLRAAIMKPPLDLLPNRQPRFGHHADADPTREREPTGNLNR